MRTGTICRIQNGLTAIHKALPILMATTGIAGAAPDRLSQLRWLEGTWQGTAEGAAGRASLQRQIVCALGCRYLNVEGQYLPEQAGESATAALGMWGYDRKQGLLLLHTFDDVASVTTYVEDPQASSGGTLVLLTENRREGRRARFTYSFSPPDAYRERFELANRGEEFELYVETRFERVRSW